MSSDDGGLRTLFHNNLKRGMHWTVMENGVFSPGVPDSNFACRGVEGWVEHKMTDGWAVTLRPAQVGWLLRRARAGGRVFVAVRRAGGELWLCRGSAADKLKASGLRGNPKAVLGVWSGGPAGWDWEEVRELLLRAPK